MTGSGPCPESITPACGYGFRARRLAAARNDADGSIVAAKFLTTSIKRCAPYLPHDLAVPNRFRVMESKRSGVERDPWRDQTMPLKLPGSSTLLIPSAVWDDGPTDLSESISTAGLASGLEPVAMRDALTALRGLLDSATLLDASADVAVRDALTAI